MRHFGQGRARGTALATQADFAHRDSVSIGNVLVQAFGLILRHRWATLGSTLLLGVIPIAAFIALFLLVLFGLMTAGDRGVPPLLTLFVVTAIGGSGIMAGSLAIQAAMARALTASGQGDPVTLRTCLAGGFGRIPSLLGLSFLMTICIGIGFVLLWVPGVIVAVTWSVAGPALASEKLGVIAALRRSIALTMGHRWKIFGLMAFLGILCWMLLAALDALGAAFAWVGGFGALPAVAIAAGIASIVFTLFVWTICVAGWGAVSASLYLELRTVREGPLASRLAEVFA